MIDVNLFLEPEKYAACYRDPAANGRHLSGWKGRPGEGKRGWRVKGEEGKGKGSKKKNRV